MIDIFLSNENLREESKNVLKFLIENLSVEKKYYDYIYEKIVKGENNLNYNNLSIYIKLLLLFYGKEIKNKKVFQRNIYFFLIQMNQIFSLI